MNVQMSVSSWNRQQSMREKPRVQYSDLTADDHSYFETREFNEYTARVEGVIHRAKKAERETGLNTRQIHERLGKLARREWTMDAITKLKSVETVEGYVDRYRPTGAKPAFEKKWGGYRGMQWLFGKKQDSATDADAEAPNDAEARTQ